MDWQTAFARQARSDLDAREQLLRNARLPHCHQLHYLQMAMEKAAKAHLLAGGGSASDVQKSHAYVGTVIPIIVRDRLRQVPGYSSRWLIAAVRRFAEQIDRLHPQIDAQVSPANCEYPRQDAQGNVVAPADHNFEIDLNAERAAVTMIKEVRARVIEIADGTTT